MESYRGWAQHQIVWWPGPRTFFHGSAASGRMILLHRGSNRPSFRLSLLCFDDFRWLSPATRVILRILQSEVRQTINAKDLKVH